MALHAAPQPGDAAPPRHVAIIMDGNGRWAQNRGWPRLVGHRRGAERVKQIVRACPDLGVNWLTVYAFSTENWKRSTEEVLGLMKIFRRYIQREADGLAAEGVRMRFIGGRERLDPKLQALMSGIEARTAGNTRLNLTVAINYGGRDEILRASAKLARKIASGAIETPSEADFADCLDTAGIPDFFFNNTATSEIYTPTLLDAQPISSQYISN